MIQGAPGISCSLATFLLLPVPRRQQLSKQTGTVSAWTTPPLDFPYKVLKTLKAADSILTDKQQRKPEALPCPRMTSCQMPSHSARPQGHWR